MKKNIVVIGAGYAGVLTAKKLEKKFKKSNDVNITIIDRNPFHTMLTELHEVAASRVDESSIRLDLDKIFAKRNVNVKLDEIQSIDFDHKVVKGNKEEYPYDIVVIATGSKPTYFGVEGAEKHSYTLWSYDDSIVLKDRIRDVFKEASGMNDPIKRQQHLTFHVVGAGFTGVEMAGELAEYVPYISKEYNIDPKDVTIVNVDGLSRAVPILPEKLSGKIEKRLNKMNVRLEFDAFVSKVSEDEIEYMRNDEKFTEKTGTVIWTAGIESSDVASQSGSTLDALKSGGRIQTDAYLRAKDTKDVYVVGDNVYYIPEGEETSVPQMVENAEHSAKTAAHNIIETIRPNKGLKAYQPKFHGVMISVGGRYGVARVGTPNFMFNLPSFLAMFAKHLINMVYFVQVLGWNKVFSYMKDEFFTIRNRRSFVGGHFSNRGPSFVTVPLRVWLGGIWLFEGIHKVMEGWFTSFQLPGFFAGAQGYYDYIFSVPTSETGANILMNFRLSKLFRIIFFSGNSFVESKIGDYVFKLEIPALDWMLDNFILKYESLGFFTQRAILFGELLVGVLLILGLFTTFAAVISIVLQLMFVTTTGWYLSTVWMFFASFALLFTAGQSFSLDYYVLQKLKEKWKNIPFVKKWYLYHD